MPVQEIVTGSSNRNAEVVIVGEFDGCLNVVDGCGPGDEKGEGRHVVGTVT